MQIKKLLFLLTFIRMDVGNRLKVVFNERITQYVNNYDRCRANVHNSPIFDLLDTAARFGLLQYILEIALGYVTVISKSGWSKLVWERGWDLDDLCWKSMMMIHKRNDLLSNTVAYC